MSDRRGLLTQKFILQISVIFVSFFIRGSIAQRDNPTEEDSKSYKICSILGGLDITRHVSSMTKSFFQGAIEDVELIREVISESLTNGGLRGGLSDLEEMMKTLDWEARGFTEGTTTIEAGLGYSDDRETRRMERFVALMNNPFVGDKQSDMYIVDTASNLFPWVIDRKAKEKFWWLDHQNGKSEGGTKEPFLFDTFYAAAWIGTYGEAWAYYPPFRVFGHPFSMADLASVETASSHELPFVAPNLPPNNPERKTFFSPPYPDSALPGASLITAMAPLYYTGVYRGVTYEDTYLASTGIDILISSVSSLLDVVDGTLTRGSFGMVVDANFNTIVMSQAVVEKIYPKRTGFEKERITYHEGDGSVLNDRRNQTYLVSDTIFQPISNLSNANWTHLLNTILEHEPGERDFTTLDVILTGNDSPTSFHVLFERWQYVADWIVLVFVPIFELENTIQIHVFSDSQFLDIIHLDGAKGEALENEITIINNGSLDLQLAQRSKPSWMQFSSQIEEKQVLKAGAKLIVNIKISTDSLAVGTSSDLISFIVEDYQYPDCFHRDNLNIPVSVKVAPRDCEKETGDPNKIADLDGNCICKPSYSILGGNCVSNKVLIPSITIPLLLLSLFALYFYVDRRHKLEDSVWIVKSDELHFDYPPVILGRGTFGLVLLANYRGTNVAVKRVIPPKTKKVEENITRNEKFGRGAIDLSQSTEFMLSKTKSKFGLLFDEDQGKGFDSGLETADVTSKSHSFRSLSKDGKLSSKRDASSSKSVNDVFIDDSREKGFDSGLETSDMTSKPHAFGNISMDGKLSSKKDTLSSKPINDDVSKPSMGEKFGQLMYGASVSLALSSGNSSTHSMSTQFFRLFQKRKDEYSELKADFIDEMRQLSKLRHPCITTVMGAVISKNEEPMLIMEYMDHGSLYDILHNDTMIIEGNLVLPILRDIAYGLLFLHSATTQVIHGDLKAQNILVDIKFRAKVADFGLSQKKKIGATGTPFWMAPELLRSESSNTAATDVYSFGVILYEIYSRKNPYEGEQVMKTLIEICDPRVNKRPPFPKSMPPSIVSLMSDCLVPDPDERPTMEEITNRLKRLQIDNIEPGDIYTSKQTKKLEEAEKNFSLLLEVFPKHIAEALRDGRKVEPEHHDCVTIYFSDIVGFTTISNSLSPAKVSDMLDRLYLAFDHLSHKHGVWKIETIGDAWMGVTNLVTVQQNDHACRIARFAIDAIRAAGETLIDLDDPSMGFVRIRVGMHSGPVLSNVVGSRTPKYSIFGDTVNTSSRMESNSLPGFIHSSTSAAQLLLQQDPDIPVKCRGIISVKGKGEMTTYWVNGVPKE